MEFNFSKPLSPVIEMVKPLEPLGGPSGANGEFQNILGGMIGQVNATKGAADRQLASFLNGEQIDIHQVATSIQKAEMTFELAIEVRNKMMQAYQEVMRMQI